MTMIRDVGYFDDDDDDYYQVVWWVFDILAITSDNAIFVCNEKWAHMLWYTLRPSNRTAKDEREWNRIKKYRRSGGAERRLSFSYEKTRSSEYYSIYIIKYWMFIFFIRWCQNDMTLFPHSHRQSFVSTLSRGIFVVCNSIWSAPIP